MTHLDITMDIQNVSGDGNIVANDHLRIEDVRVPVDCETLATAQRADSEVQKIPQDEYGPRPGLKKIGDVPHEVYRHPFTRRD